MDAQSATASHTETFGPLCLSYEKMDLLMKGERSKREGRVKERERESTFDKDVCLATRSLWQSCR